MFLEVESSSDTDLEAGRGANDGHTFSLRPSSATAARRGPERRVTLSLPKDTESPIRDSSAYTAAMRSLSEIDKL